MIRTVTLLAFIASASAIWPFGSSDPKLWNCGLSHTFGEFKELPRSGEEALKNGWVKTTIEWPNQSKGYSDLVLLLNPLKTAIGLLVDENNEEKLAGLMVMLPVDKVYPYYNPSDQGFTLRTFNINGESIQFYTLSQFFVPEDTASRTYSDTQVVQANYLAFESTFGRLDYLPNNREDIENNATTVWDKQNCMPWMGLHYYYNMTKSTTCGVPFCPFFGLYDENTNQLIGVGFMMLGKCPNLPGFENPATAAVKIIVNHGPDCLYDLVDKHEACTLHFYYIDQPRFIVC